MQDERQMHAWKYFKWDIACLRMWGLSKFDNVGHIVASAFLHSNFYTFVETKENITK